MNKDLTALHKGRLTYQNARKPMPMKFCSVCGQKGNIQQIYDHLKVFTLWGSDYCYACANAKFTGSKERLEERLRVIRTPSPQDCWV
jgi:hypothetical protein